MNMHSITTIAQWVTHARNRMVMHQGEFAKAIGAAQSNVSKWEAGTQNPRLVAIQHIQKLAKDAGIELPTVPDITAGSGVPDSAVRLSSARIAAGFTSASQAARAARIAVSTYIHYENGTRSISPNIARRCAKAFDTSASLILFGTVDAGADEQMRVALADEDAHEQKPCTITVRLTRAQRDRLDRAANLTPYSISLTEIIARGIELASQEIEQMAAWKVDSDG